jgi:hypothetical protein
MQFINDLLLTIVLKIISDISLNLSYNFFCKPTPLLQLIRVTVADRRRQAYSDLLS